MLRGQVMDLKKVSYSEICQSFKTGDLILFHGELRSSELTEILQGTMWSHVAMVINPKDIGFDYPRLLLWESNTLVNLKDVTMDKAKVGPMLVDLEERIQSDKNDGYDNIFQVRYIDLGDFSHLEDELHKKLKTFIDNHHTCGYPKSELQMFIDFFKGKFENKQAEPDKFFCSELIAATYIGLGLMTDYYVPNSYMPKDFSDKSDLPLLGRANLINGPFFEVR